MKKFLAILLVMLMVMAVCPMMMAEDANNNGSSSIESRKDNPGLETSKTVSKNEDGTYTITLEAFATGSSITSVEETLPPPSDIIMVIDQSSSLRNYCMCGEYVGVGSSPAEHTDCDEVLRFEALEVAAIQFVNSVKESAVENKTDHRIAAVFFADRDEYDYSGTGIYHNEKFVKYNKLDEVHYSNALKGVDDYDSVNEAIGLISENLAGETWTNLGLEIAAEIYEKNPITEGERNRIVVLFTDGAASHNDMAVNAAYNLKQNYGATIYTIAVNEDADPNMTFEINDQEGFVKNDNPTYVEVEEFFTGRGDLNINRLLHAVSSNYPNAYANSWTEGYYGQRSDKDYYLEAENSEELKSVFSKISNEITTGGASITLGTDAVLKDVVSEYFTIEVDDSSENKINKIEVYTATCTGNNGDKFIFSDPEPADLVPTCTGNTISVSGFDYSENWVGPRTDAAGGTTYGGKELIVEVTVRCKDKFLGGNGVPTNTSASGIYQSSGFEESLEDFVIPTVNVPIKEVVISGGEEKNVYLMTDLTQDQICEGVSVTCEKLTLEQIINTNDWCDDYVDIKITKPEDLKDLTETQMVYYSVKVSPKYESHDPVDVPVAVIEETHTIKINVFKPVVTFKDGTVKYLSDLPDGDALSVNRVSTIWKDGDTMSTDENVIMIGKEPSLIFEYEAIDDGVTDGKVTSADHVGINIKSVTISDVEVLQHVEFEHQSCDEGQDCEWNGTDDSEFWLHVTDTIGPLTITKSGISTLDHDTENIEETQSTIYTVAGADATNGHINLKVAIHGNGSVTIKDLPVGNYTVTEATAWSWRYEIQSVKDVDNNTSIENGRTVTVDADGNTVKFTNIRQNHLWLSGDNHKENQFTVNTVEAVQE